MDYDEMLEITIYPFERIELDKFNLMLRICDVLTSGVDFTKLYVKSKNIFKDVVVSIASATITIRAIAMKTFLTAPLNLPFILKL